MPEYIDIMAAGAVLRRHSVRLRAEALGGAASAKRQPGGRHSESLTRRAYVFAPLNHTDE